MAAAAADSQSRKAYLRTTLPRDLLHAFVDGDMRLRYRQKTYETIERAAGFVLVLTLSISAQLASVGESNGYFDSLFTSVPAVWIASFGEQYGNFDIPYISLVNRPVAFLSFSFTRNLHLPNLETTTTAPYQIIQSRITTSTLKQRKPLNYVSTPVSRLQTVTDHYGCRIPSDLLERPHHTDTSEQTHLQSPTPA